MFTIYLAPYLPRGILVDYGGNSKIVFRSFSISKERIGTYTERKAVSYFLNTHQQMILTREVSG